MRDELIKLGCQDPSLRPHLRVLLAHMGNDGVKTASVPLLNMVDALTALKIAAKKSEAGADGAAVAEGRALAAFLDAVRVYLARDMGYTVAAEHLGKARDYVRSLEG